MSEPLLPSTDDVIVSPVPRPTVPRTADESPADEVTPDPTDEHSAGEIMLARDLISLAITNAVPEVWFVSDPRILRAMEILGLPDVESAVAFGEMAAAGYPRPM